ncbi:MAG TPA: nicotinate-nucleotide--dimethylbenzimidazole phosphoribosyltransferase, partial [Rectinemataceae bacterium]|nr:nicotinate-nucleotide--dimethylbenzimidazole phosphoribosyltransferase [Rectinemataceae bacterium]
MMNKLEATLSRIGMPDMKAGEAARRRQATLTKPAGSLGDLETLSVRLAAMQGRLDPCVDPGAIFVMAGDHGVCAEGV